MFKRVAKFSKLTGRERLLFLEALFLHIWVGLLLKVVPFRRIPGLFASRQFEAPTEEETQSRPRSESGRQSEVIGLVRAAVQRAGRVSPWKNSCLVSSLAGRCMLRRRKINSQLSLGVAKDKEGKTVAHAWLRAGDDEIITAQAMYTELYSF